MIFKTITTKRKRENKLSFFLTPSYLHTTVGPQSFTLGGATPSGDGYIHTKLLYGYAMQNGVNNAGIRHPCIIKMSWLDLAPACLKSWPFSVQAARLTAGEKR